MPLGLLDLVAPYFFAGDRPSSGPTGSVNLGGVYDDVVGALAIREVDACWDEDAVCVWGRAGFDDPTKATHTTPDGEVFDWHDIEVRFRLTASRAESASLAAAVTALGTSDPVTAVVDALGGGTAGSDAPTSTFRLDLMLTAATLHLPFARPALLGDDGLLTPDPDHHDVKLVLPRILVTITQGATIGSVDATLDSWGATGLDTEADVAEGTPVTQDPPYALVGDNDSLLGWGFRSAVVDFSDEHTPPEILAIAGTGDDWKGVFFPEVRFFVAPAGIRGLAVDAGARNLLLGIGPGRGISGDLDIEVVNQQHAVDPHVRFQTPDGKTIKPHWTSVADDGTHNGEIRVPPSGTVIVDVSGGEPPYTVTIDEVVEPRRSHTYATLTDGQQVRISVSDSGADRPGKTWDAVVVAHPDPSLAPPGGATSGGSPGSSSTPGSAANVTLAFTPDLPSPRRVTTLDGPDEDHIVLVVSPKPTAANPVTVTLDGSAQGPPDADGHVTVPLAHDDTTPHPVVVTWSGEPVQPTQTAYFARDVPGDKVGYGDDDAWADTATMFGDAVPEGQQQGGSPLTVDTLRAWAGHFPDGTHFSVDSWASHDSTSSSTSHNQQLAGRRLLVGRNALSHDYPGGDPGDPARKAYPTTAGTAHYNTSGTDASAALTTLRKVVITPDQAPSPADVTATGTLQRQPTTPPAHVETPPAGQTPPPSWFRSIGLTVRLVQNIPIACELEGVVRFADLATQQLQSTDPDHKVGGGGAAGVPSTLDHGLVSYDLTVEWDSATGDFRVDLVVAGSGDAATDWIARTDPLPGPDGNPTRDQGRDFVGLLTALLPVMAIGAGSGDPVHGVGALMVGFDAAVAVALVDIIHTKTLTLWGFEILTERKGDSWQAALLIDVEVDIWFDVTIGSTTLLDLPPDKPMKVRYDAVGVRFGEQAGQTVLAPAFDPSRGYQLAVPDASAIRMPAPLGEILHLLAIRIARLNPLQIEADIGMKADLGVVSVDRARVRLTLPTSSGDQASVTITALGASVNIPGVLTGSGSLAIDGTGFDGSIDLALTGLGLRIAATLAVRHVDDPSGRSVTAVFASLEVDFPAPLPLLQSGLGIYGFIGLFGMHYARTEAPPTSGDDNPALDWLAKAAPTAEINRLQGPAPAHQVLWTPQADHWAVGLGIVLGTMEGGTILNLQGVVIVELPGPRLVIYVKAKFLEARPKTDTRVTGTITALVEIAPDEILVGIIVEYDALAPLLRLRVPVGAFFQFSDPSHFHIDVGTYHAPATARVLDLFDATAFVEIHGDQIDDVDPLVQELGGPLPGLAVAAGIHAGIVWGNRSSGLYLEVTADAVVGVSFSPFQFLGIFRLKGRLHLWIVSVEATAELDIGALTQHGTSNFWLSGKVCGEVDFFFFSVKGCVHVSLGTESPLADAPPLVSGLTLQARATSPVHGTATADRPVGASLTTASADPDDPTRLMVAPDAVPVDAIPVLAMETAPVLDAAFTTVGDPPAPAPLSQGTGWARRGQAEYRYTLESVALTPALTPPPTGTQSVFRTGNRTTGDDTTVQYALLDWSPDPADQVMLAGPANDNRIDGSWGWVCVPVAEPARVLWTFEPCPRGPNPAGWQVTGTAFPDPPGTRRSRPAPTLLTVHEPWRTGATSIDQLLGIDPAFIDEVGPGIHPAAVAPGRVGRALAAPYERVLVPGGDDLDETLRELRHGIDKLGLLDAVTLSAGAMTHARLLLTVAAEMLKVGSLVARPLDAHGAPIGADLPIPLPAVTSLPPEWTDSAFPALADVAGAAAYARASALAGHRIVLADLALPDGTETLMLGIAGVDVAQHGFLRDPSYTVCIVELALVSEYERAVQDGQDADNGQQTVSTATGSDPAKRPLLAPGTTYTVTVAYTWEGRRVGSTDPPKTGSLTQQFSFTTDATAPESLEPWLLYTFPSEGEKFHFTDEPPVVCFASDDVDQLVGAYGKTLHAHVVPARADLVRTSQPLGALEPLRAVCRSPFEHTLERLQAQGKLGCFDIDPGPRHGRATIDAPLDRNCDYVVDLSYDADVPLPTPGSIGQPLLRRGFSTGSFATPTELASAIAGAALEHRLVTGTTAALAPLGPTPSDTDLDTALSSIGLGAVAPPSGPRLVLLWEERDIVIFPPFPHPPHPPIHPPVPFAAAPAAAGSVMPPIGLPLPEPPFPKPPLPKPPKPVVIHVTQPVAILVDAPEPIWRTRSAPVRHTDPVTGTEWWALADQDWLSVTPGAIGGDMVPVTGVVRNAAGTRLVCLLGTAPGGGGYGRLLLTLNRFVDPTGLLDPPDTVATRDVLVDAQLGGPPWLETS